MNLANTCCTPLTQHELFSMLEYGNDLNRWTKLLVLKPGT